jgi:hypothetical protein
MTVEKIWRDNNDGVVVILEMLEEGKTKKQQEF